MIQRGEDVLLNGGSLLVPEYLRCAIPTLDRACFHTATATPAEFHGKGELALALLVNEVGPKNLHLYAKRAVGQHTSGIAFHRARVEQVSA